MIENTGSQFGFLTAGSVKQAVIHDEDICTVFTGQILKILINDICRKKRSKTEPVSLYRIQEPIERVLGKPLFEGACALLHIHTASSKNIAKLVFQKRNRRYALFLGTVTFFKILPTLCLEKNL